MKVIGYYPKIIIIVLNWNNYKDTYECINNIEKLDYKNFNIIIIDNNSTDGSGVELKKAFPQHKVITNNMNKGYTGGNNVGIRQALEDGADYVFILNNDTIINDKNILNSFIKVMENNRHVGVIGPTIKTLPDEEIISNYCGSIWWNSVYKFCFKKSLNLNGNIKVSTRLIGCALFIKKDTFNEIGLLDEDFFMYSDEDDFCLRAILNDVLVVYSPNQIVYRKVGNDGVEYNIRKTYYCSRNKIHMIDKNFKGFYKVYFLILNVLGEIKYFIKRSLTSQFELNKYAIRGIVDAFIGNIGKNNLIK